jgi:HSP20 family protein
MNIVRYSYPNTRSLVSSPGRFYRSPWGAFESEIDRLISSAMGELPTLPTGQFPVDLYEDKDNTFVCAELPGVNRDDINVEMVDGYLTISASRKTAAAEGQPEQSFSFSRSVRVPEEVQADKVSAAFENGVLTVTLPKREETKPTKITVAVK